ncbi:universal stress protein [Corynebacterium sp. Q4381]|uniref:universal stress protein n=1 Tax=Corynebacterium sp. Marseille-Q4381 TaxID=3121597 RepID=UPI002FE5B796
MHSYSSVAVGTDGTPRSMAAVRAAASLARVYGAKLTILCAHYSASGSVLNSTNAELTGANTITETESQEILARAEAVAEEEQAGEVELISRAGKPANVLIEAVAEIGADLLVVGNKGMHSLAGRVFGTVPGNVAVKARVDVMLVDTRAEARS